MAAGDLDQVRIGSQFHDKFQRGQQTRDTLTSKDPDR